MKLVIASNNGHKVREIKKILGRFFKEIVTIKELGLDIDPEETGNTFEENSLIKAKAVCLASGLPALADDSGLCVNALGGAPGVYSARFAGIEQNDEKNIDKLLDELKDCKDRTAEFVTVVTLVYPDGKVLSAKGRTKGKITYERKGAGGFGYDPVFYSRELNKTFGEATEEEKNAVSHRGKALESLKKIFLSEDTAE
ncbi:MAG: XTP/dITP diphosphatase [Christensenellales bacterium]